MQSNTIRQSLIGYHSTIHFLRGDGLLEATQADFAQLQEVARKSGNVFEELMETVKVASLGQITDALFNVGGQYRRNM